MMNKRKELDYECDGVVIKVEDVGYQHILSHTKTNIRWGIAYKESTGIHVSYLREIEYSIGINGNVNCVGIIDPIKIDNVMIRKINLHNLSEINRRDIRIGDLIEIERKGGVIPKLVEIRKEIRGEESKKFIIPSDCPFCKEKLINMMCKNEKCWNKLVNQLLHNVNKIEFKGIGKKTAEKIIKSKTIFKINKAFYCDEKELDNNFKGKMKEKIKELIKEL